MKRRINRNIMGLALITIFLITSIFVLFFNQILYQQRKDEIQQEAAFTAAACETSGDAAAFLRRTMMDRDPRVTLVAADGTVLFDNKADAAAMNNHLARPEIQEAYRKGKSEVSRHSDTLRKETYYYAIHLSDGTYLRLASSKESIFQTLVSLWPVIFGVALVTLLCSFFVSYRLSKKIINAINQIDLKHPMETVAFEELWPLLNRIEKQNKQINTQVGDLLEQEHKFNTITQNMNEGLILLDTDSKIRFMNRSCKELFDYPSIGFAGKHISSVNRSEQMLDTIAAALKGHSYNCTLDLKQKQVQLFGNPVIENETITGVVLFVLDITEKQKAERLRKEFSANVSHELKTPLTSISGYAELMQNQLAAQEDIPAFAAKIYEEAARLLALVNDIIKVSRLDEGDIRQIKELVDIYSVAEEVVQRLLPVAAKHEIRMFLQGAHVSLYTQRQLMYDMIYNLCENAIKYNLDKGSVTVVISEEDGHPQISVSDTGIGIAMEYQERIFERFYRIDKSHSKQTGGTGLGLSIVKHVVEYHEGYIEVHSNEEEGTEIKVHL